MGTSKIDITNEIFSNRNVVHRSGPAGLQIDPQKDNRYRVNPSDLFYVIQLVGTWVHMSESAERVIAKQGRQKFVRFENKRFQLRPAEKFHAQLDQFTRVGCDVHFYGIEVTKRNLKKLKPFPFIYIASQLSRALFNAYYVDKDTDEYDRLCGRD